MKKESIYIKNSKVEGKGIFSKDSFKKGAKLFKFANKIIKIEHKAGCHCNICKRCINLRDNLWLYPSKDSFGWNLNHSCNPNAYSKGKYIFALKNIKPDEEVTIDYSTTNTDAKWKMKCSCKSNNCRKNIRSIQFLPSRIFKKYKGLMQRYIEGNYKY